ncbi:hypothetical protein ES703_121149 [subsurface metagenome]
MTVAYTDVLGGLLDVEDANDGRFVGRLLLALDANEQHAVELIEKIQTGEGAPEDVQRLAVGIIAAVEERGRSTKASKSAVAKRALAWALEALGQAGCRARFCARVKQRTCEALARKRARGEVTGGLRYGYRSKETDRLSNRGRPVLREEPDAAEQIVIRRMVSMRESGSTYRGIAEALNADDVPTQRGGPWLPMTVWKILARDAGRTGATA